MLQCKSCGSKVKTVKHWKYSNNYFYVKLYRCQNCGLSFKAYYHNGELSHTIPRDAGIPDKGCKTRMEILKYLRHYRAGTCYEIASKLGLDIEDVFKALNKLKNDGLVENA